MKPLSNEHLSPVGEAAAVRMLAVARRVGGLVDLVRRVPELVAGLLLAGAMAGAAFSYAPARADEPSPLVLAILIYNGFPDTTHRIGTLEKPGPVPSGTIGIPAWLLDIPMTRSEAGALVSAIGAFITPDTRRKPRKALDRAARFERLLAALDSCPGALAAVTHKVEAVDDGGEISTFLRGMRTERPEYAAAPDPTCGRNQTF